MKTRLPEFQYLNTILQDVISGRPFQVSRFIEIGTRKSSKTAAYQTLTRDLLAIGDKVGGIDIHWIRYNVADARELLDDFIEEWDIEIPPLLKWLNQTKRRIRHRGNQLRIHGLHTVKKSGKISDNKVGLSKGKVKYAIVIREEAHQIPRKEVQAFMESIRGYEYVLEVDISNPWSIYNELIQEANRLMPFNEKLLTSGDCDQFGVVDDMGVKTVVHYSNWRNNPFLAEWEKQNLMNLLTKDPIRARVSTNGMPGLETGAIYADYMPSVVDVDKLPSTHFVFDENRNYYGGVDWGVVNDSSVCQLWAVGVDEDWVAGIKRAGHNNKPDHRDFDRYRNNIELEEWVVKNFEKWAIEHLDIKRKGLTVHVEQAELAVIDHLNAIAEAKELFWLEFRPGAKPRIKDRIDATTATMSVGRFFISCNEFEVLVEELSMSAWEEPEINSLRNKDPKRVDMNDHDINTMEYAIYPIMYNIDNMFAEILLTKGKY